VELIAKEETLLGGGQPKCSMAPRTCHNQIFSLRSVLYHTSLANIGESFQAVHRHCFLETKEGCYLLCRLLGRFRSFFFCVFSLQSFFSLNCQVLWGVLEWTIRVCALVPFRAGFFMLAFGDGRCLLHVRCGQSTTLADSPNFDVFGWHNVPQLQISMSLNPQG
jgi:hypothetical protein